MRFHRRATVADRLPRAVKRRLTLMATAEASLHAYGLLRRDTVADRLPRRLTLMATAEASRLLPSAGLNPR